VERGGGVKEVSPPGVGWCITVPHCSLNKTTHATHPPCSLCHTVSTFRHQHTGLERQSQRSQVRMLELCCRALQTCCHLAEIYQWCWGQHRSSLSRRAGKCAGVRAKHTTVGQALRQQLFPLTGGSQRAPTNYWERRSHGCWCPDCSALNRGERVRVRVRVRVRDRVDMGFFMLKANIEYLGCCSTVKLLVNIHRVHHLLAGLVNYWRCARNQTPYHCHRCRTSSSWHPPLSADQQLQWGGHQGQQKHSHAAASWTSALDTQTCTHTQCVCVWRSHMHTVCKCERCGMIVTIIPRTWECSEEFHLCHMRIETITCSTWADPAKQTQKVTVVVRAGRGTEAIRKADKHMVEGGRHCATHQVPEKVKRISRWVAAWERSVISHKELIPRN